MVSRRPHHDQVDRFLDTVRENAASRTLLVRGPAGSGKSTLLTYAARRADAHGFTLARIAGARSESDMDLLAVGDLVHLLRRAAPGCAEGAADPLAVAAGRDAPSGADRRAVCAALRALVGAVARRGPLLVCVDDAHSLDASSAAALLYVARRPVDAPVALLVAERDYAAAAFPARDLATLRLGGVDRAEAYSLLAAGGVKPAAEVVDRLMELTRGNPQALLESAAAIGREALEGRAALADPPPIGPRTAAGAADRLALLGEETRRTLEVAAASHSGALGPIRHALHELGLDPAELEGAELAGLIRVAQGTLAWEDEIVRAAIYHAASCTRRRAAHAALAGAPASGPRRERHGWHLAAAATLTDDTAADALAETAERAAEAGDLVEAVHASAAAARLTTHEGPRSRRLVAAATRANLAGRPRLAAELLAEAAAFASEPATEADAERERGRIDLVRGAPDTAEERLLDAAARFHDADPDRAAWLALDAGVARIARGDCGDADSVAAASPRTGALPAALVDLLRGVFLAAGGDIAAGLALLDAECGRLAAPGVWARAPELIALAADAYTCAGRHDEAAQLLDIVLVPARRTGALGALPLPLAMRARLDLRAGRTAAGRAAAIEAVEAAAAAEAPALLAHNRTVLASVESVRGDAEGCRAAANGALELMRELGTPAMAPAARLAWAQLEMAVGAYDAALALLRPVVQAAGFERWRDHVHDGARLALAECAARAGDAEEAARELAAAERDARRAGTPSLLGQVERCRGVLAADDEAAVRHLGHALELLPHAVPLERAIAQLFLGERLRRARRRSAARMHLQGALAAFDDIGAAAWSARCRGELEATGARAGTRYADGPVLTAKERQIAEAVAAGATNKEVAASLFVSPKTVEVHLTRVFRKVGVRSRSELARAFARPDA